MTVAEQARAFAAMVLCGAATGLLHDLLALLRRNPYFTAAADLLLGIGCALEVIAAGLLLSCDPFRMYTILGVGTGWAVYHASVGICVRILMSFFIELSKNVGNCAKDVKCMQENAEMKRI